MKIKPLITFLFSRTTSYYVMDQNKYSVLLFFHQQGTYASKQEQLQSASAVERACSAQRAAQGMMEFVGGGGGESPLLSFKASTSKSLGGNRLESEFVCSRNHRLPICRVLFM